MRLRGKTFALIAPVQLVLHQASCSNETIQNASKHYETHQNMSLGSNGVDQVHSLQKIPMRLRGTKFCINCTSSARFVSSLLQYKTIQNAQKHYETHQYMSLVFNGVDRVRSLRKIPMQFHGTNLCINLIVQPVWHRVLCNIETIPNAPKRKETHQNMSLGSNGVDQVHSLRTILA